MKLSATAKAILGILAMGPSSGYEIKRFVDNSTRFFWAASYGQIYPELRRLSQAGLVEGTPRKTGARKRVVYRLTTDGEKALRAWHELPPEVFELRNEGMLKLFLATPLDPARTPKIARECAAHGRQVAARLREIEAGAKQAGFHDEAHSSFTVLRYGIELNDWIEKWFEGAALEMEKRAAAKPGPGRRP